MTVVPPVNVFAPVSESAPAPAFESAPAPSMTPVKTEEPLRVRPSVEPEGMVIVPAPARPAAETVRSPDEVVSDAATTTLAEEVRETAPVERTPTTEPTVPMVSVSVSRKLTAPTGWRSVPAARVVMLLPEFVKVCAPAPCRTSEAAVNAPAVAVVEVPAVTVSTFEPIFTAPPKVIVPPVTLVSPSAFFAPTTPEKVTTPAPASTVSGAEARSVSLT